MAGLLSSRDIVRSISMKQESTSYFRLDRATCDVVRDKHSVMTSYVRIVWLDDLSMGASSA